MSPSPGALTAPVIVQRLKRVLAVAALASAAAAAAPAIDDASASHFRGGQLNWVKTGNSAADFTYTAAFRRDGYQGTAADGYPAVGDEITENIGGTGLDFGDTSQTSTLEFVVIAINASENWLIGKAIDPATGDPADTLVGHAYGSTGPFTAFSASCCTISDLLNNSSGDYVVGAQVDLANASASPVSSLQPIVTVGNSGVQNFNIPALVPAGLTRAFRLATDEESCQSCGDPQPPGLDIDTSTGEVTWDTTGKDLGLYYASVIVEARNGAGVLVSASQVTFLVNVIDGAVTPPPTFSGSTGTPQTYNLPLNGIPGADGSTPPDGSIFTAASGQRIQFQLNAGDGSTNDVLHIDHLGLPAGATFTPVDGNPATAMFDWTPTQDGSFLVSFYAVNNGPATVTATAARAGSRRAKRKTAKGKQVRARASATAGQAITYTLKVGGDGGGGQTNGGSSSSQPSNATPSAAPAAQEHEQAASLVGGGRKVLGLRLRRSFSAPRDGKRVDVGSVKCLKPAGECKAIGTLRLVGATASAAQQKTLGRLLASTKMTVASGKSKRMKLALKPGTMRLLQGKDAMKAVLAVAADGDVRRMIVTLKAPRRR